MPSYSYTAINSDGFTETSSLRAADLGDALSILSSHGLTPIAVKEGHTVDSWWNRDITSFGTSRSARSQDLEDFFNTFSVLLKAKLPLTSALRFCEDRSRRRAFRRDLRRIREAVENGASLSEALAQIGAVFPLRYRVLLELGEKANDLEKASADAADMLRQEGSYRRQIISALIYPSILAVVSLLVLGVLVFVLAPTLAPVFDAMGRTPPLMIRVLSALNETLTSNSAILMLPIGCLLALAGFLTTKSGKVLRVIRNIVPMAKRYHRQRQTYQLCRTMAVLLKSGAPLLQTLEAVSASTTDVEFANHIGRVKDEVSAGAELEEVLGRSDLIDPIARALLQVGHQANALPDALKIVADDLGAKTNETTARAVKLVTPILTLLIGLGVGSVILSTLSAIMDLNDIAF